MIDPSRPAPPDPRVDLASLSRGVETARLIEQWKARRRLEPRDDAPPGRADEGNTDATGPPDDRFS